MREKLIKLLRSLEEEGGYKNEYTDRIEPYDANYWIEEYLTFPDFRFLIKRYNDLYAEPNEVGLISVISSNAIRGELKRMEADGLVIISAQEGKRYASTSSNEAPDFDDGVSISTEAIILSTRGKNQMLYLLSKLQENPIGTSLSVLAVVVSILALFMNSK